ncbi:Hypothetical predicted protein [Olea europaea subsp. europaea]|uniref:Uncharacterized protein n=1 Tax=Olea europaea subsp. europaea TaxID=158383 RepID=A0A8S0TTQ3_OLEEU|nr:Hypothetical predicted protein [Olea europaea subsp. europaea]
MEPDFQAVSRKRCAGHVRDVSGPHQGHNLISKHFSTVFRTWCAGHVPDVAGTKPDVQAFLGSFWDRMYRPCLGHGGDTGRFLSPFGHGVQAMSGTCPSRGRDAT